MNLYDMIWGPTPAGQWVAGHRHIAAQQHPRLSRHLQDLAIDEGDTSASIRANLPPSSRSKTRGKLTADRQPTNGRYVSGFPLADREDWALAVKTAGGGAAIVGASSTGGCSMNEPLSWI